MRTWRQPVALLLCAAAGCTARPPPPPAPVSDSAERGPIRLTVEAAPPTVWLGDPIAVDIRVETPADYLVRFEPLDPLGELHVRNLENRDPRPSSGGGLEWRQRLVVDSLASGEHALPPVVIKYARRPDGEAQPSFDAELATRPLKLEFRSALTSQDSTAQPRDITAPLLPPWRLSARQAALVGGALGGLVAAALLAWWVLRRLRGRGPPPVPPEVWALRELSRLDGDDWIETGRAREYYYRLTEIVRGYVERKFGLAAPEMTTEEFLRSLDPGRDRGREGPRIPYDAGRLRAFLESCDLVKYAAAQPRRQEAEDALLTARAFVDATAAAANVAAAPETAGIAGRRVESEGERA